MPLKFKTYQPKENQVQEIADVDGNILEVPKLGGLSHVEMRILSENIDIEKLQQNTFGSLDELTKYVAAMLRHRLNIPQEEEVLKYPDGRDFSIEFLQQIANFFNEELALTMKSLGVEEGEENDQKSSNIKSAKAKSSSNKRISRDDD